MPQSLVLLVHADPATLEERFDRLRQELWDKFYIPVLRREGGEYVLEVVRRPPRRPYGSWVNLLLLVLTIVTVVTAGAFLWVAYVGGRSLGVEDFLWGGLTFGAPLLAILGLHELAHYILARRHHVEASLPYFVPVPPPFLIFGTFGAFISIRQPIPDRKALLDIGASGPLAGFAVAIPVTIVGLYFGGHAPIVGAGNCGPSFLGVGYGNLLFGESLLFAGLSAFVPAHVVSLSPIAIAGWVGLLVTAINLLPAGQLDGGHVFRALFGDRSRYVSWAAVVLLFGLGFLYPGWWIFAFLIILLGVRHQPPLNDITRLDPRRWAVGGAAAAILVVGFVLIPISSPTGGFSVTALGHSSAPAPPGFAMANNTTLRVQNQDVIDHGFLFSASLASVYVVQNGTLVKLTGAALAAYAANATWVFHLPSTNTTTLSGATPNVPEAEYSLLSPGATGILTLTYLNRQAAVLTLIVTVSVLCPPSGGGSQGGAQSVTFSLP